MSGARFESRRTPCAVCIVVAISVALALGGCSGASTPVDPACTAISRKAMESAADATDLVVESEVRDLCSWQSRSHPTHNALYIIQFGEQRDETTGIIAAERMNDPAAATWAFGDEAITRSRPGHASAVARIGTAVIIADANGLKTDNANVAAAQQIVRGVAQAVAEGRFGPFSSDT